MSTSGGGGGKFGDSGDWGRSVTSVRGGGGGGRRGSLESEDSSEDDVTGGKLRVGSGFFIVPSADVFDDREVEEEDTETEDSRLDFLSGTLGFILDFAFPVDIDFRMTGTGVSAVGVLDWLEYPLDGDVTLCDFSGEIAFVLATPEGTCGIEALDPSLR